jgi:peptidoglycan/LPS O-acetylase OafA/YrhL
VRNYLLDPPTSAGWYTGHFWSLSVEEHFYIFWPLLLVAFGNRRALAVAGFLALAVAGWRELDGAFHLISLSHVTRRTDTCADALLWGCWAALMLNDAARREWVTRWLTPGVWAVLVLVELAVIVGHPPLGGLVQTFLMPWLLVGTVLRPSTAVGRFLERPWLSWLGRLSYSLYLWQQLFFIGSPHLGRPYPLGWIQDLPLNLAAALGCSAASYYLVERPMIGMGQRLARSLQRPATALTPVTPVGVV